MNRDSSGMSPETLRDYATAALDELKARDQVCLCVNELTQMMDYMVVASGTSRRHVKALADNVVEALRKLGQRPLGVEGDNITGWILVDFGDVVVHVMSEEARNFYELEKLWSMRPETGA